MASPTTSWSHRRVLVTGSTGLLGTETVQQLVHLGAQVVGLVRDRVVDTELSQLAFTKQVYFVHGHCEDAFRIYSALAIHEVDVVFHLATTHAQDTDRGTTAVFDAVRRYNPQIPVITAHSTTGLVAATAGVVHGIARFGELFGPRDRKTYKIVPATVMRLLAGDRVLLAGDGRQRDFVFARDAARACILLAEALVSGTCPSRIEHTFRTGWCYSDQELAVLIRQVFEGSPPALSEVASVAPVPGWTPQSTLTEALRETIEWYRGFLRSRFFGIRATESSHRAAA